MGNELKPTLWRTARVLSNRNRLNLMRLVANAKGAKGVGELALEAGLPVPIDRKGKRMKKDFGVKTWLLPMPVLMIGSYNDDDTPNVMTAAWGGTGSDDLLTVCIDSDHKTWANIEKRKAFTVAVGVESEVKSCDALGCVSGNKVVDKVARVGWHTDKSAHVDAPIVRELPLVFECELVSMDESTCLVIGRVVNVAADESVLTDSKPDSDKIRPIAYDPLKHEYRPLGEGIVQAYQERID